jgi:hypothetical protein
MYIIHGIFGKTGHYKCKKLFDLFIYMINHAYHNHYVPFHQLNKRCIYSSNLCSVHDPFKSLHRMTTSHRKLLHVSLYTQSRLPVCVFRASHNAFNTNTDCSYVSCAVTQKMQFFIWIWFGVHHCLYSAAPGNVICTTPSSSTAFLRALCSEVPFPQW